MNQVIAWAGFRGAWPLVAGPLYQGALELLEEDIDREGIEASIARIRRPDPPSPWWWLLPPVMYLIRRDRNNAFRQAALAQLTQAQRDQSTSFINKAIGWYTVALGAADAMAAARITGSARAGRLRLSFHVSTSDQDADLAADVLRLHVTSRHPATL